MENIFKQFKANQMKPIKNSTLTTPPDLGAQHSQPRLTETIISPLSTNPLTNISVNSKLTDKSATTKSNKPKLRKRIIDKNAITIPIDFKHVQHIGLSQDTFYTVNII
jgi:hypothetical protein